MDFGTLNTLLRCSREFGHKKIRSHGIGDTESTICCFVASQEGCSQDDISTHLHMDKTTVAKAVGRLEEKEFVIRTRAEDDRRRAVLSVTDKGRKALEAILQCHDMWLSRVLGCLSRQEQAQFEGYCLRLVEAAEKLSNEKGN